MYTNVFNFTAASANKCYRYRLLKQGIAAEYSYQVETVKADIALPGGGGTAPQSYGTLLAIWDHTVLPATRHK